MDVLNVHERKLNATRSAVGGLLDSLSSDDDRLWPRQVWPQMKFDRALGVGAAGGHGPIRYYVEAYSPGESVRFRFVGPAGFHGYHGFEIVNVTDRVVALRHVLQMRASGIARLSWPLVFRPLHDALIEDCLATAEASLGSSPRFEKWSPWVRMLRWVLSRGTAPRQKVPTKAPEPAPLPAPSAQDQRSST
jgi:hypothetical protein